MKHWNKIDWESYVIRLYMEAQKMEYSIEFVNLIKRIKWINENRIWHN